MAKVILEGHIVVPDRDLIPVMAELPIHVELTRKEEGCLHFEVTRHAEDRNVFNVYEEFASRRAFESHQLRVRKSRWGKVAANVERHYTVTELS